MTEVNIVGKSDQPHQLPDSESYDEETQVLQDAPPGSVLGELRNRAVRQQQEKQIDIPVGGDFEDWLMIRYRVLQPGVLDNFIERRSESGTKAVELNMDLIASACVAIIGHNPVTGDKQVLSNAAGRRLGLEGDLLRMLEMPVPPGPEPTAREVIMLLFANNGMAIGDHGDKLTTWMRSPSTQIGELGEV